MSEIPSDVSSALLESPTTRVPCLEAWVPQQQAGSRNLVRVLAEGSGSQPLLCSEKTAQGTDDMLSPTSASRLPSGSAPCRNNASRRQGGRWRGPEAKSSALRDGWAAWGRQICTLSRSFKCW